MSPYRWQSIYGKTLRRVSNGVYISACGDCQLSIQQESTDSRYRAKWQMEGFDDLEREAMS
jgi:hypothetical protein